MYLPDLLLAHKWILLLIHFQHYPSRIVSGLQRGPNCDSKIMVSKGWNWQSSFNLGTGIKDSVTLVFRETAWWQRWASGQQWQPPEMLRTSRRLSVVSVWIVSKAIKLLELLLVRRGYTDTVTAKAILQWPLRALHQLWQTFTDSLDPNFNLRSKKEESIAL